MESEQKQGREQINFFTVEVFNYLFKCFSIFDYAALLCCIKDGACLEMSLPACCLNICGSFFVYLFCLLERKLLLGCKTIWESMRKLPCSIGRVGTFLHLDIEETSFFHKICTLFRNGLNIFHDTWKIKSMSEI